MPSMTPAHVLDLVKAVRDGGRVVIPIERLAEFKRFAKAMNVDYLAGRSEMRGDVWHVRPADG